MGRRRILFAFASMTAIVAAAAAWRLSSDPVRELVTLVGHRRVIEARLSGGFDWAPLPRKALRSSSAERPDPQRRVRGERSMLASVIDHRTASDDRADAMAQLLFGENRRAVSAFEQLAVENPHDPHVWSDLAAARYEAGVATDDASLVAESLAAADAALQLDSQLPEALFNRAVAIEHLGIREEARKAWTRFLAVDGASEWAAEADERIRQNAPIPFFMVDLRKNYDRLAADPEFAHEMARERPEETRLYSEAVILYDWATAAAAGDTNAAERHLRVAREFGRELAHSRGEHMVQEAVRAIEQADDVRRQHLIRGHRLFREGQDESKVDRPAKAQGILSRAVDELSRGGSPISGRAEFIFAETFNSLGNAAEARRRELRLLADTPREFPAHRAQILWYIGKGYQAEGDFGKALETLGESVAIFDDLGEADYAAAVRELMAEVYDRNGNPEEAWRQRLISLRGVGRLIQPRLASALENAGRGAMKRKEWPVALSLLRLAGDMAVAVRRPTIESEVNLLEARAFAETGDADAARASIAKARVATAKIDDAAERAEALIDVDRSEAMLASPAVAIVLLTRAIDFHATRGHRVILPELFLTRGRVYRNARQIQLAAADFEAGIAQVEKHRESLPQGELRWGTFDTAAELFEEAVGSAIGRGDTPAAFAYAERSRARALLETFGGSTADAVPASFNTRATMIEYFSLPDRLVIFAVSRGGIRVAEERIERDTLEREAAAFRIALAGGAAQHRQIGASLYQHLIAPIDHELSAGGMLVFVPGLHFPTVAFAALQDGNGYLVQRHEIVVAPSAATYERLAARKLTATARKTALIIANPTTSGEETLAAAEVEANDVARLYVQSRLLLREGATLDAYRRFAPSADVIHVGTHGVETSRGGGALVLSDGMLDSKTIASVELPHTSVVVLAACDSARGPAHAEGTISAARGFLAAGVPSVVATLWKIDDGKAAEFFPRLHRDLARGVAAATALRMTQIESIERGESPAMWAAVQCIGTDGG